MNEASRGARLTLLAALLGLACGSKDNHPSPSTAGAPGSSGNSSLAGSSSGGAGSAAGGSSHGGAGATTGGSAQAGNAQAGSAQAGRGGHAGSAQAGSAGEGGAASGGAGGGNDCGELANQGVPISEVQHSGEPPAPQGGTLLDGDYVLTGREVYSPSTADAEPHTATLRLMAGQYELVRNGGVRETGTFSTMSIALKLSAKCPSAMTLSKPYTATATTLSITTVSENLVEIFSRQ